MRAAAPSALSPKIILGSLLSAAAFFCIGFLPATYVGAQGDDASFVLAARSMLQGQWRALCVPGQPFMPHFLPGYPLFLAPFVALFQPHWMALQAATVLLFLGAIALLWMFLAPRPPLVRYGTCALFALHPLLIAQAVGVMADPFIVFMSVLVFLLFQCWARRPSLKMSLALSFFLGWALLTKPTGILLWLSVGAAIAWLRQWRFGAVVLAPSLAAGALWSLWTLSAAGTPTNYLAYFSASLKVWTHSSIGALEHAGQVVEELFSALWLLPEPSLWAALALGGLFLWGLRSLLKERPDAAAVYFALGLYVLFSLLVLALWAAGSERYLLPLIPFALFLVLEGLQAIGPLRGRRGLSAALALWVLFFFVQDGRRLVKAATLRKEAWALFPEETLAWIRQATPPNSVFLGEAALLYLYTGRQGYGTAPLADAETFRYYLLRNGVTHIFWRPRRVESLEGPLAINHQQQEASARSWTLNHPAWFTAVYRSDREQADVRAVRADAAFMQGFHLYQQALLQLQNGRAGDAIPLLRAALRASPDLVAARHALAVLLLEAQADDREAEALLQEAVRREPTYIRAWRSLFALYQKRGQTARAARAQIAARAAAQSSAPFEWTVYE